MTSTNLYIIENNNTISCLQKNCTYKFRDPKDKQKGIMEHYRVCHKDFFKQLKNNLKPYSRPVGPTKLLKEDDNDNYFKNAVVAVDKEIFKESILKASDESIEGLQNYVIQYQKQQVKNVKSFVFHYFIRRDYYAFKFYKEITTIKLVIFKNSNEISFCKASETFNFSFTSINNDTLFNFGSNLRYLYVNNDVKFAKIYLDEDTIFETNNFQELFN